MADVLTVRSPVTTRKPRARSGFQSAVILDIVPRTPRISSVFLAPAQPFSFTAGQHVRVRVTLRSGVEERKYSIASAPESGAVLELAIEALVGGEVSGFFHRTAQPGESIEIRGPLGDFTWSVADGGPVLLVGGGSGLVPLMSMIRHRALRRGSARMGLIYSASTWADVLFREELSSLAAAKDGFELMLTLTRESAARPGVSSRRIDRAMVAEMIAQLGAPPKHVFLCGSDPFVESARAHLEQLGVDAAQIGIESYGV